MRLQQVVFMASTECADTLDILHRMGLSGPQCPPGTPGFWQLDLALPELLPGRRIELIAVSLQRVAKVRRKIFNAYCSPSIRTLNT